MRTLVVILDGASFVFCHLFCWYMPNVKHFWQYRHRLMYVDEVPVTPAVLNTMFTGKPSIEHGVKGFAQAGRDWIFAGEYRGKYIWDRLIERGFRVKVVNVPVKVPPVWVNTDRFGMDIVDCYLPPKERFEEVVNQYHEVVKRNLCDCDVFIVWYPVPDQAHHYLFPTIGTEENYRKCLYWYDKAFAFARDLIEIAKPRYWLVVSDHGFTSDFDHMVIDGRPQPTHVRDATAVTNAPWAPGRPAEVYDWIMRTLFRWA